MKYFVSALLLCSLVACGGGNKSTNAAASGGAMSGNAMSGNAMSGESADNGAIPNCGAVKAVWVNTKTKVYHEPTDPMYGHTKHGKYMCPSAAKAEGDRPAGARKHHEAP